VLVSDLHAGVKGLGRAFWLDYPLDIVDTQSSEVESAS
jgi:hypothetical protein